MAAATAFRTRPIRGRGKSRYRLLVMVMRANDCRGLTEKRWLLPPHSKALRAYQDDGINSGSHGEVGRVAEGKVVAAATAVHQGASRKPAS